MVSQMADDLVEWMEFLMDAESVENSAKHWVVMKEENLVVA